jgi:hypothetical protein
MSGALARINHAADVMHAGGMGTVTIRDLREASAAVAELIEALKQCISCEFACTDKEAVARAEAAIAACKGGEQ